ncbi:MAG TPA: NUDIX domain-containing protein [Ktedonobacteraceae bacterium]|nr:NUDIX domain-containing protein [Ktedonobacteraceae bacterium]
MSFHNYSQLVTPHPNKQYVTGKEIATGGLLPDAIYSQALDTLVIACVDILPVHGERILLGRRSWEPQQDWWCFGGRMRKGELYQIAAQRNALRELFCDTEKIEIDPDRFTLIGIYNLLWDTRAQAPTENGCHMISITMMLPLTENEIPFLCPNEEYHDVQWALPDEITSRADIYHPCLIQMIRDASTQRGFY